MAAAAINLGGSVVGGIISGISARKKKKELEAQANWLRGRDINEQSYYQDKLGNATTDYLAPRGQAWDIYSDVYRTGGFRPEEQEKLQMTPEQRRALDYSDEAREGLDLTAGERSGLEYGAGGEGMYMTPEEQASLYYSPEERAQIELTPERAQEMRAVSGTGISRAYQTARGEAGRMAARRGGYVPGMNATLAQMAREQGETASETAMRNEGDIYQMGATAADRLAAQRTGAARTIAAERTGTAGTIAGQRIASTAYGSEARRAAIQEAQRSRGAAAKDVYGADVGATTAIQEARERANTTAGAGFSNLSAQDLSRLQQLEGLRAQSNLGYAGAITGQANTTAGQPGFASSFFNTFSGGGSPGTWSPSGGASNTATSANNPRPFSWGSLFSRRPKTQQVNPSDQWG